MNCCSCCWPPLIIGWSISNFTTCNSIHSRFRVICCTAISVWVHISNNKNPFIGNRQGTGIKIRICIIWTIWQSYDTLIGSSIIAIGSQVEWTISQHSSVNPNREPIQLCIINRYCTGIPPTIGIAGGIVSTFPDHCSVTPWICSTYPIVFGSCSILTKPSSTSGAHCPGSIIQQSTGHCCRNSHCEGATTTGAKGGWIGRWR